MEENTFINLDNILIICRHSERIDYTKERSNQKSNKGDPELTNNGIILAKYFNILDNYNQGNYNDSYFILDRLLFIISSMNMLLKI